MDNALLMAMVHGIADLQKQLQALSDGEFVGDGVLGDGHRTRNILHGEIGYAAIIIVRTGFVDLGDVRVTQLRLGWSVVRT